MTASVVFVVLLQFRASSRNAGISIQNVYSLRKGVNTCVQVPYHVCLEYFI